MDRWTKRYIFNPTKEEYFRTKHPIASASMVVPMILYYLIVAFAGVDRFNWLLVVGFFGSMIFGVGACYTFAVIKKIYEKVWLPILCLLCGVIIIAVSLFFCF